MRLLPLFLVIGSVVGAASAADAQSIRDEPWPDYQDSLVGHNADFAYQFRSTSPVEAEFPVNLRILPPDTSVASTVAQYSGVYRGFMCSNRSNSIGVAFTSVNNDKVTATITGTNLNMSSFVTRTLTRGKQPNEFYVDAVVSHKFRLRANGVLDFMWRSSNDSCTGVLRKSDELLPIARTMREIPWPQVLKYTNSKNLIFESTSKTKAVWPAVKVSAPDPSTPPETVRLLGSWEGAACEGSSRDIKIVFTSVSKDVATATMSINRFDDRGPPLILPQTFSFEGNDVVSETPRILYRYRFHEGPDGARRYDVLDVLFALTDLSWCGGTLRKIS